MNDNKLQGHYFINDSNLKSEIKEFKININGQEFKFKTDNGVFSKGELDFGTNLLIKEVLNEKLKGNILDFGCGYGAIGIILNKLLNLNVHLIDVNKRAIHLTNLNIKDNNCKDALAYESDGYSNVNTKFDYIVSNPPIRIGKDNLYKIIKKSREYLKDFGKIYLVIRKEQGAKTFIRDFSNEYKIEVLTKKKGFYIICLKSLVLS